MKKHLTQTEKQYFIFYIKLLSALINSSEYPEPFEGMSWERVLKLADMTRTSPMLAEVIVKLTDKYKPEAEIIKKLSDILNKSIFVDGIMEFEGEKIISAFERHGVKNAPVKGYFLKKEYPQTYYRTVSDFDILFDKNQLDAVKAAFSDIGYEFLHNDDNQYHFQKKPFMYIEMHSSLVHDFEKSYPYVRGILDKAIARDGYKYSRCLSPEDHYLYLNIHASKHYRLGGIGLRFVLDEYIYYSRYGEKFDFDYLGAMLENCGIAAFEKKFRETAFKWFSPDSVVEDFNETEEYILMSFALGRLDVGIMVNMEGEKESDAKRGKRKSKFSYFVSSLLPNREKMVYRYPYLERFPFLLPVAWTAMWGKRLFIERNVRFKGGFKNRLNYEDEDVEYYKRVQKEMGFSDIGIHGE